MTQARKLDYGTMLDSVAANADEADRTVTLDVSRVTEVTAVVDLVRVAATTMTMKMFTSTNTVLYGREQGIAPVGGVGTLSDFVWSNPVTGNETVALKIPVKSVIGLKLIFAAAGGGADDKITVTIMGGA